MLSCNLDTSPDRGSLEGESGFCGWVGLEVGRVGLPISGGSARTRAALADLGMHQLSGKLDGAPSRCTATTTNVRIYTRNLNAHHRPVARVAALRARPVRARWSGGEAISRRRASSARVPGHYDSFGRDYRNRGGAPVRSMRSSSTCWHVEDGDDPSTGAPRREARIVQAPRSNWRIPGILNSRRPDEARRFSTRALIRWTRGRRREGNAARRTTAGRRVGFVARLTVVTLDLGWFSRWNGARRGAAGSRPASFGARCPDGTFVMVGKTFRA